MITDAVIGNSKRCHILTTMAKDVIPDLDKDFYLAEWMALRVMDQITLAVASGVSTASISRYLAGKRWPTRDNMRSLERALRAPRKGLLFHPSEAPRDSILTGLRPEKKEFILEIIKNVENDSQK